jgi:hypothetical protein
MIDQHLAIASAALTAVCVVPYLRGIRLGNTRPQRTTWFVFATVSVVASVSQLSAGGGAGVWLSAGSAIGFAAVFAASIRGGVGGWSRIDRVVLVIAALGVVASVVVSRPVVAIVAVVLAEIVAVALTVRKAASDPASETMSTWVIDCAAGGVAIAAVDRVSTVELLYPIHHTIANAAVVAAIVCGRWRSAHVQPVRLEPPSYRPTQSAVRLGLASAASSSEARHIPGAVALPSPCNVGSSPDAAERRCPTMEARAR